MFCFALLFLIQIPAGARRRRGQHAKQSLCWLARRPARCLPSSLCSCTDTRTLKARGSPAPWHNGRHVQSAGGAESSVSHTAVYVARNNFKQPWQEEEANSHLAPRVGSLCPSLMRALYRAGALRSELVTQPHDKKNAVGRSQLSRLVVFGTAGRKTLILSVHTGAVLTQPEHTDPRRDAPRAPAPRATRLGAHTGRNVTPAPCSWRRGARCEGRRVGGRAQEDVVQPSVRLSCSEGLVQKYLLSRFPFS